ncbi:MAG TPA: chemotaxis protein CheB [Telmatospirillum sp.]|nr:chemotaxis protein CheB [Telmatospirillum sp.]
MTRTGPFHSVVIGCSAGGLDALRRLFSTLPTELQLRIVVVAHTGPDGDSLLAELLGKICRLPVVEATEKTVAMAGQIHIAPPGYHLLVERDGTFSLSIDPKVCNVRPSIDVLFQSAADAWGSGLIGILLTGANSDGTEGLRSIKRQGGYTVVQDPDTAFADTMPRSAVAAGLADRVLPLEEISIHLLTLPGAMPGRSAP